MPAFPGAHYTKKDARTEGGKASYTGGDARAATEKEMRRQVTAIRLRNALDPTRFYRGGSGTGADKDMPAYAQLGTIVGGGLEPKSIVPRKQRADSVVGELVNDARSIAYSKKKFNEVRSPCPNGSCKPSAWRWPNRAAPSRQGGGAADRRSPRPHVLTTCRARGKTRVYLVFPLFFFSLRAADTGKVPVALQSRFRAAVLLAVAVQSETPVSPRP